jgi:hypothetical protein
VLIPGTDPDVQIKIEANQQLANQQLATNSWRTNSLPNYSWQTSSWKTAETEANSCCVEGKLLYYLQLAYSC